MERPLKGYSCLQSLPNVVTTRLIMALELKKERKKDHANVVTTRLAKACLSGATLGWLLTGEARKKR